MEICCICSTFGYAWPIIALAPISPTLEHFNKMAEAVTVDFDERFCKVVCKYRVLYDKGCKDFKDKRKKTQAWFQVGNTVGMTKGNMNDLQFFPCEMYRQMVDTIISVQDSSHLKLFHSQMFR